jgi:hypothetical protein
MTIEPDRALEEELDLDLGERYFAGSRETEEALADEIADITEAFVARRFQEGRRPALRDAHAKDTGCVRAVFHVDQDLDPALRHGVLRPGGAYEAWIRFSNGNSERLSDRWPDARGMAVKLMGVSGPRLPGEEAATQDFIMANNPVFFVDDLARYRDTLTVFHSGGLLKQYVAAAKLKSAEALRAVRVNFGWISNPLLCSYWSMTPYRLGAPPGPHHAIKFMARPRSPGGSARSALPKLLASDFSLKAELGRTLAGREMSFDFYLQRRVDERTPVEDTTTEWTEAVAAPEHVATITIPPQDVGNAGRDWLCENLSFNPWHGLVAHKPLGAVNRVRRRVYARLSAARHRLNGVVPREPSPAEIGDPAQESG